MMIKKEYIKDLRDDLKSLNFNYKLKTFSQGGYKFINIFDKQENIFIYKSGENVFIKEIHIKYKKVFDLLKKYE